MTPQAQRLLAAIERVPLTTLEIQRQLGIGRAAARVYELREELEPQGRTVSTELVPVENRFKERARVARYSVVAFGAQGDLFVPAREGRAVS
jgi:hypothetical protein